MLYISSGTTVNYLLDNPCTTLPLSENWLTDFPNSRCYRTYLYEEIKYYKPPVGYSNASGAFCNNADLHCINWDYYWNGTRIGYGNNISYGGFNYTRNSLMVSQYSSDSSLEYWSIKKSGYLIDYKAFSSF